jgi:uncharacterized protein (TIGR02145 family)
MAMGFDAACDSDGIGDMYDSGTCTETIAENHQGICPPGWHLPSLAELQAFLSSVDPTKLLSASWMDNKDDYGFSALAGGYYEKDGLVSIGNLAYWWIAAEKDIGNGIELGIYGNNYAEQNIHPKKHGFNVRCLKDN